MILSWVCQFPRLISAEIFDRKDEGHGGRPIIRPPLPALVEVMALVEANWIQSFPADRTSSGNYFVLFVTDQAKRSRDEVCTALKQAGIQTKRYFYPPVHEQTLFQQFPVRLSTGLTHTVKISREALALPLYSHMTEAEQARVCEEVEALLG